MKRILIFILLSSLFSFNTLCGAKASSTEESFAPDRIIIKTKPGIISMPVGVSEPGPGNSAIKTNSISSLQVKFNVKNTRKLFKEVLSKPGMSISQKGKTVEIPDLSNYYIIDLPEGADVKKIADEYRKNPDIELAFPDYIMKVDIAPNDPYFKKFQNYNDMTNQWGLFNIKVQQAWDLTVGSSSCVVAVLDSGVNYNHEDLEGRVIKGWDFANDDPDPMDDVFHGTHVSGIIGANANNGKGIAGIILVIGLGYQMG